MSDLISRQSAIDAIADYLSKTTYTSSISHLNTGALILAKVPSAQSETAKRIVGKSRDGMILWYQCDMCNEPVDAQDNFCRGCGRRLTDG